VWPAPCGVSSPRSRGLEVFIFFGPQGFFSRPWKRCFQGVRCGGKPAHAYPGARSEITRPWAQAGAFSPPDLQTEFTPRAAGRGRSPLPPTPAPPRCVFILGPEDGKGPTRPLGPFFFFRRTPLFPQPPGLFPARPPTPPGGPPPMFFRASPPYRPAPLAAPMKFGDIHVPRKLFCSPRSKSRSSQARHPISPPPFRGPHDPVPPPPQGPPPSFSPPCGISDHCRPIAPFFPSGTPPPPPFGVPNSAAASPHKYLDPPGVGDLGGMPDSAAPAPRRRSPGTRNPNCKLQWALTRAPP